MNYLIVAAVPRQCDGETRTKTSPQDTIDYLEKKIDEYIEEAPELERFILPGGTNLRGHLFFILRER